MSALILDTAKAASAERRPLALALMVMSGFAALGYQIVWTQQCTLWLGHESAAVLAVVAAFFGGSALGALTLGSRIEASPNPARWYAACEAIIGCWSIALAFLLPVATHELVRLIGPQPSAAWHWFIAFSGTALLLLPATAAMGATLPAMQRMIETAGREGQSIALLYAGNTFGAVAGVLVATFELVPQFGLERTAYVCASLNLLCAAVALQLSTTAAARLEHAHRAHGDDPYIVLFCGGLLGIGYEVLVVRVVSQVAENTVYTFAMLLAVYLLGTALGAAAYQRVSSRKGEYFLSKESLLQAQATACLLGVLALANIDAIKRSALAALGSGLSAALAAEALLAIASFLLPTLVMGALFSHLCTLARLRGMSFGRALGINTVGAAAAPILFGVLLVPALGSMLACLIVPVGYLLLAAKRAWRAPTQWVLIAGVAAIGIWTRSLVIVDVPEGGRLLHYAEGALGTVSVVEDANAVASLHINNRQQEGSSATVFADARQGLLPILLHPAPHRTLFLGLGTGVTASAAAREPSLQVDAVELLPEAVTASAYFRHDGASPPLRVVTADARRFVRASETHYDVIVADNFHPARSGSGALYTVEHFQAIRERLAAGGVFCQWLPLHQLDLATLRVIVRAFRVAYPHGWAMLSSNSLETPVIGLVALNAERGFDVRALRARLRNAAAIEPEQFSIEDEFALLGSFIAGADALARFAGSAPLNTDDHPVVTYLAPRITYAPTSLPRDRLLSLLQELHVSPDELLAQPIDRVLRARLTAYWSARDRFLAVGRTVQATNDVRDMLARVREPLLSVLRISPDFRPAYEPLLRMAAALAEQDVDAARALLVELQRVQPTRPEAAELLQQLSDRGGG